MLEQIRLLRQSKKEADRREAIRLLDSHLAAHPDDVAAWSMKASRHDFLGEELEAEPCYARVHAAGLIGLKDEEKPAFYIGYGSTLRNNDKLDLSEKVLREGVAAYPNYGAAQVFLAFTLYSLKREAEAARVLFAAAPAVAAHGLDGFDRAVAHYSETLP